MHVQGSSLESGDFLQPILEGHCRRNVVGNSYHDNSGVSLLTEIECYGGRYFPKSFEHSCWPLILGPIEEEFFFSGNKFRNYIFLYTYD